MKSVNVSYTQADVLEYYDQTVNSPNGSFYIPAVLRVIHYSSHTTVLSIH